ncbi:hypothetical protein G6W57_05770 [Streptomyces sp. CAI-121]|uniref:hypothetical protein n=1 Tax=unclassified Streptomyces TaxID=2593676 RepID=UPI001587E961|nr:MULTISPECIES: hypothetical protein [unclassified Streptomyces]NUV66619.1 hypothetical protein [Streptomyces sp. CAI-121]NUW11699.1 hypothetical protein [Streptomyces sp. CAI-68]
MGDLSSKFVRDFEERNGYEPGENCVVEAASSGSGVLQRYPDVGEYGDLLDFYERIEKVTLPDVGNGLFVDSVDDVVEGRGEWQPSELRGAVADSIVVFGSDGGGGLFAVSLTSGKVYSLEGGSMAGVVYEVGESGVQVIADDLWGFMQYLRGELLRAVR